MASNKLSQTNYIPQPHLHGGQLNQAAKTFNIPLSDWLDLSTGINPTGWLPGAVPAHCWSRLPEQDDGLQEAACRYYGCNQLLMTAGTQPTLQTLPKLRPAPSRVGLLQPSYYEHERAWTQAGHEIQYLDPTNHSIEGLDVVLVVNPNNPTGHSFAASTLVRWQQELAQRGGWLIVDEAFIDATPEQSLAPLCPLPGLIVLRSLGKFFGLAGLRCGSVIAEPNLLSRLDTELGPWTLSHPSRWIAKQALEDTYWQQRAREHLPQESAALAALLDAHYPQAPQGTALFQTVHHPQADLHFQRLAEQGVLVRHFAEHQLLRFGLPPTTQDLKRLAHALSNVT